LWMYRSIGIRWRINYGSASQYIADHDLDIGSRKPAAGTTAALLDRTRAVAFGDDQQVEVLDHAKRKYRCCIERPSRHALKRAALDNEKATH
jgi:hypothetical protein